VSLVVACTARDRERPVVELEERPALDRHIEQRDIAAGTVSFDQLFAAGDRLFHNVYNGLDGVGAMRTAGGAPLQRFSIGPVGGGQPIAVTAQSCGDCHAVPFAAGAGHAHPRVLPDPDMASMQPFNARGTTSLHGNGLLQLLAQEMTEELQAARDAAAAEAKQKPSTPVRRALAARASSSVTSWPPPTPAAPSPSTTRASSAWIPTWWCGRTAGKASCRSCAASSWPRRTP
jgi:hypothetical protein